MYKGKQILVTGGAGFLGSNLVRTILPEVSRIFVLDDLFTGRLDAVPASDKVVFIHGSVTDATLVRGILSDVDYVFHLAARNIVLSATQPESDFHTNVEGTVQLLLNALSFPHIQRIVYTSTSSIYGNCKTLPIKENEYDISVPYAASKMAAELMATAYHRLYGLPITCLRLSNVYGPGQDPANPYCGVVSKFMQAIYQDEPMVVFGDGTQTRDFTFVDDAIAAILMVGQSECAVGEIFNVGTGMETKINELANTVAQVTGKIHQPIGWLPKRSIDTVYRRSIDAGKLRRALGWEPREALKDGLEKTWAWFQKSKERTEQL